MSEKHTLFEKVWEHHVVCEPAGQLPLVYIDLHLVHEVTSPQAFDGLRGAGRPVRQPLRTVATVDHNIPTSPRGTPITDPIAARQIQALQDNCKEFGVPLFDMDSPDQGIVTAEEVQGLDLRGCELAVLSACQTGLGKEDAGGQGVFSLQRAFQGVDIASLKPC